MVIDHSDKLIYENQLLWHLLQVLPDLHPNWFRRLFALSFLIYFELEKDFKILFPLYMYGNH